ncbi:MAG: hypothetical protein B7733_04450 [Myxococcales bacterium FL481]|nr:MAG: hypothetical protein B7733_04450 [Myxococcales bacterium FL481]
MPVAFAPTLPRSRPAASRWWWRLVWLTLILNVVDALCTIVWAKMGVAREANVLLRDLIEQSALLFFATKLALVSLGLRVLWTRRGHRLALGGILVAATVYYLLLLYHLQVLMVVALGPDAAPAWLLRMS